MRQPEIQHLDFEGLSISQKGFLARTTASLTVPITAASGWQRHLDKKFASVSLPDRSLEGLPVHWYGAPEAVRYDGGHGKSDALITNKFIMGLVENRRLFIDLRISPALTRPIEKLRMLLQKGDR